MIMRIYYQLIVLYCNVFMYRVYSMQKYLNTIKKKTLLLNFTNANVFPLVHYCTLYNYPRPIMVPP